LDSVFFEADSSAYYVCDGSVWWGYGVPVSSSSADNGDVSSSSLEVSSSSYEYHSGFDPCRFNFGAGWQAAHEDSAFYAGVDYISVWLGDNDFYNGFESRMFDMAQKIHATPMVYAYVIAEFGKDHGFVDCDTKVNGEYVTPNLCTDGANIIREYFQDSVLYRYQQYLQGFRDDITYYYPNLNVDTVTFIWLIEPDFYQYSVSGSKQDVHFDQTGGAIPDSLMGVYFGRIVDTIKTYLPGSKIAIDISPWVTDQAAWYSNFDLTKVDYASTSGGATYAAGAKIRARTGNNATWAGIAQLLNKPVLADAGYDQGGAGTGYAAAWGDATNLNARIADGVIGVTQMDADSLYTARLDTIRPQLNSIPWCKTSN